MAERLRGAQYVAFIPKNSVFIELTDLGACTLPTNLSIWASIFQTPSRKSPPRLLRSLRRHLHQKHKRRALRGSGSVVMPDLRVPLRGKAIAGDRGVADLQVTYTTYLTHLRKLLGRVKRKRRRRWPSQCQNQKHPDLDLEVPMSYRLAVLQQPEFSQAAAKTPGYLRHKPPSKSKRALQMRLEVGGGDGSQGAAPWRQVPGCTMRSARMDRYPLRP